MRPWALTYVLLMLVSGCTAPPGVEEPQEEDGETTPAPQLRPYEPWSWTGEGLDGGVASCDAEAASVLGYSSWSEGFDDVRVPEGTKDLDVQVTWVGSPIEVCLYLMHEKVETWQPFYSGVEDLVARELRVSVPAVPGSWRVVVGWNNGGAMSYEVLVEGR